MLTFWLSHDYISCGKERIFIWYGLNECAASKNDAEEESA